MSTVPAALTVTTDVSATVEQRETEAVRSIIFFDGVCGLCNRSVDFVLKRDRCGHFQFAPLQGDTARALLTTADLNNLNTVVLLVDNRIYRKSAAVVRILWKLDSFWSLVGSMLWLIPLPLRNLGYSLMAYNRYQFFGKKETCRLPTPEERSRFLP